jgi:hypothetical protein
MLTLGIFFPLSTPHMSKNTSQFNPRPIKTLTILHLKIFLLFGITIEYINTDKI